MIKKKIFFLYSLVPRRVLPYSKGFWGVGAAPPKIYRVYRVDDRLDFTIMRRGKGQLRVFGIRGKDLPIAFEGFVFIYKCFVRSLVSVASIRAYFWILPCLPCSRRFIPSSTSLIVGISHSCFCHGS